MSGLTRYWIGIDPVPDVKAHKGLRDNGTAVYLAADVEARDQERERAFDEVHTFLINLSISQNLPAAATLLLVRLWGK
jgi:hypothetical protein